MDCVCAGKGWKEKKRQSANGAKEAKLVTIMEFSGQKVTSSTRASTEVAPLATRVGQLSPSGGESRKLASPSTARISRRSSRRAVLSAERLVGWAATIRQLCGPRQVKANPIWAAVKCGCLDMIHMGRFVQISAAPRTL